MSRYRIIAEETRTIVFHVEARDIEAAVVAVHDGRFEASYQDDLTLSDSREWVVENMDAEAERPDIAHDADCTYRVKGECSCLKDTR